MKNKYIKADRKDDIRENPDISEAMLKRIERHNKKESKYVWRPIGHNTWIHVSRDNDNKRYLEKKKKEMMKI
jgi:hypothetical protein